MVEYFRLKDSLPAYTAGQRTGDRLRQRRSLADFAKALQTGDYNAASGSLAQMGDVQGAMNVRRIPSTDEADRLGNEYTQTRIEDVGIDNRRADRTFAANQAQRQHANARAEAEFRLKQAKANSTLGKLKMDLDAGYITKEQFDAAVEKATTPSKGVTVNTGVPSYNNEQAKAAGFTDRMRSSESILTDTQDQGVDKWQSALEYLPFGADNLVQSEKRKQFEQAKRDFINAILRRESGAAIGKDEFASADAQYFPQPGDTEAIIQQKARNRALALQGVERAAGQGYQIEQQQRNQLQPGTIEDGWQFLGGNPADPNSWRQVQ